MSLLNTILDTIFPVNCIGCSKRGIELCKSCIGSSQLAQRECPSWVFPLYDYRSPIIRKAISLLKYKGKKRLAKTLAEAMYGRMLEELSDLKSFENFHNVALIPIPLSKSRLKERGFNQAILLCRELEKIDGGKNFKTNENILFKIKDTPNQAKIKNRVDRVANISGSFAAKNAELLDIILIDDVLTTGATLKEARGVLKEAGARKVIAFTLAH